MVSNVLYKHHKLILTLLFIILMGGILHTKGYAEEILQTGKIYQGETKLISTTAGIGLTVPKNYHAGYNPQFNTFFMQSSNGVTVIIYGYSHVDLLTLGQTIEGQLAGMFAQLVPQNVQQPNANTLTAHYLAQTAQGVGIIYAEVRIHGSGNGIGVAALSYSQDQNLKIEVQRIFDSITWHTPAANQWHDLVIGKAFIGGGNSNDYDSGYGGHSYVRNRQAQLDLCSNSQYRFYEKSKSYFSSAAGSIANNDSDQHQGQWHIIGDLVGNAILALIASDGRIFYWAFREVQNGVTINGKHYQVQPSQQCR